MKKCIVAMVGALGSLLLLAPTAAAQDYRGRIQGTVLDASKSSLPGATVTVRNDATGVVATFVTDTAGRYIFDFVDPGTYTLTAELQGFKKAEQTNLRVAQRATVAVDLILDVGGLEESVTVESDDHRLAGDQREPSVSPRLRERLRRRRQHAPSQ